MCSLLFSASLACVIGIVVCCCLQCVFAILYAVAEQVCHLVSFYM